MRCPCQLDVVVFGHTAGACQYQHAAMPVLHWTHVAEECDYCGPLGAIRQADREREALEAIRAVREAAA